MTAKSPSSIAELDVVALLEPLAAGLAAGQVGTVVERLTEDVFEVEFVDDEGRAYAQLPLKRSQILPLHFQKLNL